MEAWAKGNLTGETTDQTIQLNSKAIGEVQTLQDAINWITVRA